jgi:hypothetical protein
MLHSETKHITKLYRMFQDILKLITLSLRNVELKCFETKQNYAIKKNLN